MNDAKGFTLLELMVTVGIVAILSVIAVPSYESFVIEGKRAEGVAFAMDIASRQERHFTQWGRYAGSLSATGEDGLGIAGTSENGYYTGSTDFVGGSNVTFEINVAPNNFTDAECNGLRLFNTGEREITGDGDPAECWR